MNKINAIKSMSEGHKIRCKYWGEDNYIMFNDGLFIDEDSFEVDLNDLSNYDCWEIYEFSAIKTKIWKWLIKEENYDKSFSYYETLNFHPSFTSVERIFSGDRYTILKRLDYTMIEV